MYGSNIKDFHLDNLDEEPIKFDSLKMLPMCLIYY